MHCQTTTHVALALIAAARASANSTAMDNVNATHTKFDRATADRWELQLDRAKAVIMADATCWNCSEPLTHSPSPFGDIRSPAFLANATACALSLTERFLNACGEECGLLESSFMEANEAVCGLLLMELLYYEEYGG